MFPENLLRLAAQVLDACQANDLSLSIAESCTGGLLAGCLTAIPGSSVVLERGFVTYSNSAKNEVLGVPESLLAEFGAVSEEVAQAMAEGALKHSHADIGVAVTGIAGPGGGSEFKPVGLVYIAAACRDRDTLHRRHIFTGGREEVRIQAVEEALELLMRCHIAEPMN